MKAIRINEFVKNYDSIQISSTPQPIPRDGEVLIKIAAAGVNYVDLLYSRGLHQNNRTLVQPPFTLGLEFAGTVLSSPPSSSFQPGDRVFGGALGSYATNICVPTSSLTLVPPQWSLVEAAGIGATAPVSYGALITRGGLQKGETVLIHAAAGGLGLMAVQIAKAVGAHVVATASTPAKLAIARQFGADHTVCYGTDTLSETKWWNEVLALTKGEGVDVVFDPVGLVSNSLRCLKWKGRILVVGFAGREGDLESVAMNRVLLKQAVVVGYRYGMTSRLDPTETAQVWSGLKIMWDKGELRPTVFEKRYEGLESVVNAMKDLSKRKVWGKAVVSMSEKEVENAKPRL